MEKVKALLANHGEVNDKNKYGAPPMHQAAEHGRKDVAELLLAHGADVEAWDDDGNRHLHRSITDNTGFTLPALTAMYSGRS